MTTTILVVVFAGCVALLAVVWAVVDKREEDLFRGFDRLANESAPPKAFFYWRTHVGVDGCACGEYNCVCDRCATAKTKGGST